jgi:6-pyruvoyltetrahydropterin/6-carboxytetrahydropterin synthase
MFRLTREVRFALNDLPDDQLAQPPSNSYGGYPSLTGWGQQFRLQLTIEGELDPQTGYLRNIKDIDDFVRKEFVPRMAAARKSGASLARLLNTSLTSELPGRGTSRATLWLTPTLAITQLKSEPSMTRLSQKFEFSASHRLHNPSLNDEENRKCFGKCNHLSGHGHNYELQVTLRGKTNDSGLLVDVPAFERIVQEHAVEKLDHRNLNIDVPEFSKLNPTVENIAMIIYRMLRDRFSAIGTELASVTVWETPKTWCEYSES